MATNVGCLAGLPNDVLGRLLARLPISSLGRVELINREMQRKNIWWLMPACKALARQDFHAHRPTLKWTDIFSFMVNKPTVCAALSRMNLELSTPSAALALLVHSRRLTEITIDAAEGGKLVNAISQHCRSVRSLSIRAQSGQLYPVIDTTGLLNLKDSLHRLNLDHLPLESGEGADGELIASVCQLHNLEMLQIGSGHHSSASIYVSSLPRLVHLGLTGQANYCLVDPSQLADALRLHLEVAERSRWGSLTLAVQCGGVQGYRTLLGGVTFPLDLEFIRKVKAAGISLENPTWWGHGNVPGPTLIGSCLYPLDLMQTIRLVDDGLIDPSRCLNRFVPNSPTLFFDALTKWNEFNRQPSKNLQEYLFSHPWNRARVLHSEEILLQISSATPLLHKLAQALPPNAQTLFDALCCQIRDIPALAGVVSFEALDANGRTLLHYPNATMALYNLLRLGVVSPAALIRMTTQQDSLGSIPLDCHLKQFSRQTASLILGRFIGDKDIFLHYATPEVWFVLDLAERTRDDYRPMDNLIRSMCEVVPKRSTRIKLLAASLTGMLYSGNLRFPSDYEYWLNDRDGRVSEPATLVCEAFGLTLFGKPVVDVVDLVRRRYQGQKSNLQYWLPRSHLLLTPTLDEADLQRLIDVSREFILLPSEWNDWVNARDLEGRTCLDRLSPWPEFQSLARRVLENG